MPKKYPDVQGFYLFQNQKKPQNDQVIVNSKCERHLRGISL